ncbi:uncharacterized protein LOC110697615 [Chenopodium quinoa]|uniref:uncharacterized protein LOC110697615 n=1 Tax=Chenopodium quinoa TaxID=63459 RepID=UPI000B76BB81|nr:uncharacterized protein LOC110697615 [Chenopodium quinoa]
MGDDITKAVLDFFTSRKILKQINNIVLTLIPKIDCAEEGYNNKRMALRCTIKVDMRKDYDSFHWNFVEDIVSVMLLAKVLKVFEQCSGLSANVDKTAIYFGNMDSDLKRAIMDDTHFSKGNLSYAARVVPVNVVLMSLHTYWAQVVILPKAVMHRITQLCKAFLWSGNDVLSKAPPISWERVFKLKKYGGLGVGDCGSWNKVALGKCDGWAWKRVCVVKEDLKEGFQSNGWGRLRTRDKLVTYGVCLDISFLLCGLEMETREHLFFKMQKIKLFGARLFCIQDYFVKQFVYRL